MIGAVLVVVYLGYRTLGAFTLEYWVDRNAITVIWGVTRQIIPMGQIERIVPGPREEPLDTHGLWHWPCPHRRRMVTDSFGTVNAYSTRPLPEQVVLVTASESYSISPADPQRFLHALQERFALGANRTVEPQLQRPPVWTWPLWRDRTALVLMGAGLLGVLIMFGALAFRYPGLSSDLPLHFDVTGLPDRISPKSELFNLPMIGLVVWILNTGIGIWLYRHVQRGAAYLLWFGALGGARHRRTSALQPHALVSKRTSSSVWISNPSSALLSRLTTKSTGFPGRSTASSPLWTSSRKPSK